MIVYVKGDEPYAVTAALQELKRKMKKHQIMSELRRREFYMSPSEYKRYRKNEAEKRRKREQRKQKWFDETHPSSFDDFVGD
jgi:ribosomal protein S21